MNSSVLRVGGGLGLSGLVLGLSVFVAACAGFDAALYFSPAVMTLGIAGGVVTALSPKTDRDSAHLAGFFLAILAILGGMIELAAWQQWAILFNQHN